MNLTTNNQIYELDNLQPFLGMITYIIGVFTFTLWLSFSSTSWAEEISGKYMCQVWYPDGSSDRYLIEVTSDRLNLKHLKYPINNDYRLIYSNQEYSTSVFEMFPAIVVLSSEKEDVLEWSQYQYFKGSKDELYSGSCVR